MREYIDGNEAIARAAIAAGCDFFAGYPITPATSILLHMTRELPKVGGIAIQGEDEIASIGFCIGASLAGKRVMTATSGPGISLYSESIGAAIMIEAPMVIVDVQRMGPATGAPTLGSYGDVQFIRWGNSGGFPIIALCPTNATDCYNLTLKAFELAERFQIPVFLLTDKETSLTKTTIESKDLQSTIKKVPESSTVPHTNNTCQDPASNARSTFGGQNLIRVTTSSHTPAGYLTKEPEPIRLHNLHLSAKIMDHLDEISLLEYDQDTHSNTLIISYGITAESAREAVRVARYKGSFVSSLIIYSLWPVPENEIRRILSHNRRIIIPELNLGLYKREIERLLSDHHEIISLTRQDGGLISPEEILALV
jgi:2-oxoglutarate ferredoxin oxidoreductase subunit alpha